MPGCGVWVKPLGFGTGLRPASLRPIKLDPTKEGQMDWIGETIFEFLLLLGVAVNWTFLRRLEKHLIQMEGDMRALRKELKESRSQSDARREQGVEV